MSDTLIPFCPVVAEADDEESEKSEPVVNPLPVIDASVPVVAELAVRLNIPVPV